MKTLVSITLRTFALVGAVAFFLAETKTAAAEADSTQPPTPACEEKTEAQGYEFTMDTCEAQDLTDWAHNQILPMLREWYPKLINLLPSEGFEPPKQVTVKFKDEKGVAGTSGARIQCSTGWFRRNLKGEALGAVFHELVHVVQHYGHSGHERPDAVHRPGWLVEGMADYLRWFKFEPQSHGADLVWMRTRRNLSLRYDAGYRITANFLNWASETYDANLVPALNTAMRDGKSTDDVWSKLTSHTVQELGDLWKKDTESKLAAPAPPQ